jgi:hypothetical protein
LGQAGTTSPAVRAVSGVTPTVLQVQTPDARAVQILMDTYWTSSGWRDSPRTPSEDLRYAVEAGLMFEASRTATHDEIVASVAASYSKIAQQEVADCFLASLSTRRLDLRSALSSFVVAGHLQPHPFQPGPPEISGACAVCGLFEVDEDIDLNVLNFERFKWGGVRRSDLTYIWLDLQQFGEADRAQPTDADRTAFEQLLHTLAAIPADWTASKAAGKPWAGILSNKAEREVLLDILGVYSVLETPEHRGFMDQFVRAADRTLPPYRYVERAYPVCWWRAEYGVNRLAVERLGL